MNQRSSRLLQVGTGAPSAFHPVHSPSGGGSACCRAPTSPTPTSTSMSTTPTSTCGAGGEPSPSCCGSAAVVRTPPPISLLTLKAMTPPPPLNISADGGASVSNTRGSSSATPSSTANSPNVFSPTIKCQPGASEGGQSFGLCQICSDRATGKHYGANSCDGCKGFFRRTVRKDQHYTCRFNRSCLIDKDKRNTCRFCRFKKCLNAGMRRDAVQNERDRISVKRTKSQSPPDNPPSSCASADSNSGANGYKQQHLLQQQQPTHNYLTWIQHAEDMYAKARTTSVITNSYNLTTSTQVLTQGRSITPRLATVNDLADSIKQQLLLLVEWAKSLQPFYDLSLDDQVTLLRAYAAEHLLLGVARRSLPYKDVLLLSNDACIPRSHSAELHDVNRVVFRILDELVEPMRDMHLDDTENGCLKALLFFNPSALGLTNRQKVKEARQNFLEAFSEYVSRKETSDKVRFGNLLLLLPPLQAMSQQFIEDLQLATLFGMATFDKLLEELLLAAAEPLSAPFLTEGITAVANKMAAELNNSLHGNSDGMHHGCGGSAPMDGINLENSSSSTNVDRKLNSTNGSY